MAAEGRTSLTKLFLESFKKRTVNFSADQVPNLDGRVAIVTGASSGLGLESTLMLAKNRAQVIMACRNVGKATQVLEKLKKDHPEVNFDKVSIMELDLSSLASVKSFAANFMATKQPIHILMNNAGIMAVPKFELSKDGIEAQLASNHFGHFYLTLLLTPILERAAKQATGASVRVVNLSSAGHRLAPEAGIDFENYNNPKTYDPWPAYGQSKLANILFSKELQKKFEARGVTNIVVNAVHPGGVNTNLSQSSNSANIPAWAMNWFGGLVTDSVEVGVLTQLYAATSPEIDEKNIRAQYLVPTAVIEEPLSLATDPTLASKLWDFSIATIKEKGFPLTL